MPQSLAEYAAWLDSRNLIWPEVPPAKPTKATPYTTPLRGIRAVTFDVYGTLLRITGGQLMLDGPDPLSLQVAFEKTVEEFNVWNYLFRKPGPAWKQVYEQYQKLIAERRLTAAVGQGDVPEIDAATDVWSRLITQWDRKEFAYDEATYGDRERLAEKIAYFFHSRLQGFELAPGAADILNSMSSAGIVVSLLSDAQCFTRMHLCRAFGANGHATAAKVIDLATAVLSFKEGVRKPSASLYRESVERFRKRGIEPRQILHVGSRLADDLAAAKRHGMRTALYAGDSESLVATKTEVRDPQRSPDRLLTELSQLRDVLSIG